MKILVVENNLTDLKLIHSVLARGGHEVSEARTAEEALEMMQKDTPQVILTDLKLPQMDGLTLTRQLKKAPDTSDIPIMAMSSFLDEFPLQTLNAAGFAAYFVKPINTRTFSRQVTDALNQA